MIPTETCSSNFIPTDPAPMTAGRIHMFNADIHKFSADLDEHWAKAETMGFNLIPIQTTRRHDHEDKPSDQ
ncbi:hypothetical protein NDA14_005235 [Ustilago hordei]|nr:hypothetical protein NDA14_005235 [Ustilago hordei]